MLILVAVTVNVAVNSGLFGNAQSATRGYSEKQAEEQAIGDGTFNIVVNGVTYSSLEELEESLGKLDVEQTIINENNLKKAIVQDDIALIQTAEGATTEIYSILQRMRELAVSLQQVQDEMDRESIVTEIENLPAEITNIAMNTSFNNTILLDGTFSKKIAIANETLTIKNCTAEALNVICPDSINNASSESDLVTYIGNIDSAIQSIAFLRGELGANQNGLEQLYNFYENANQAISNSTTNYKKDLAKIELNSIKTILQRNKELATLGAEGMVTEQDLISIMTEIKSLLKTINTIVETKFNEELILDGSNGNIAEINLKTLGIVNHLQIDNPTAEQMKTMMTEYENAFNIIDTELAKI